MKFRSSLFIAYTICSSAGAQPAGYHVGAAVVLPDSLVEIPTSDQKS